MENNLNLRNILEKIKQDDRYQGRELSLYEIKEFIRAKKILRNLKLEDMAKKLEMPIVALKLIDDYLKDKGILIEDTNCNKEVHWATIKSKLKKLLQRRPESETKLDQCSVKIDCLIARLQLMWENLDIQGKRILILGDDDFLSIGIGLLMAADEITVIELDKNIVSALNYISKKEGLNINIYNYDYRNPFKKNLKGRFDVSFADPPYTLGGISTCLRRSIEALKSGAGQKMYLCFSRADFSTESLLKIQGIIYKYGINFVELFKGFNSYNETNEMKQEILKAGYKTRNSWFVSSLAYLETTEKTANIKTIGKSVMSIYDYEKWN